MKNIKDVMLDVLQTSDYSVENTTFPNLARLAKLVEEHGEFAQAVMIETEVMTHKVADESPFHEASDMIMVILDVLNVTYPNMSHDQIIENLTLAMMEKREKWRRIMGKSSTKNADVSEQ